MTRLKKGLYIGLGTVVLVFVLVIAFASPLSKYLIEKYDEKFLGRKITLQNAYVNPFTGYVYFSNVKIYEPNKDSLFLSVDGLSADFTMSKLFFSTYEITELTLQTPRGSIVQKGDKHHLNFDDIIEKFSPDTKRPSGTPLKFSILSVVIKDGVFSYTENQIPINYSIKKVNIQSSGFRWNADTITAGFFFESGTSEGTMKGNFTINTKNLDYRLAVKVDKYNLDIIGQYLKDITNYGVFRASLDADMRSVGNFKDRTKLSNSGTLAFNQFHFGRTKSDDEASFEKLVISIIEVNPQKFIYSFDSIALTKPYLKYERYDYLDNVQVIFGKQGELITSANANQQKFNLVIEIGKYIKEMSRNLFKSRYTVKRMAIYNGNLRYNDYTRGEKFSAQLLPFNFAADTISKAYKLVNAVLVGKLNPYGNLLVKLSINPNDSSDFDISYHLQNIPLAQFNPYIKAISGFPFTKGTLELQGNWHVRNSYIISRNKVLVIDPRIGNRIKTADTKWLPLRFIQFFVREQGNVIDYDIPITGNLKNPKFKFKDAIFDALKNTIIKPVTTVYRQNLKNTELEIEHSLYINWAMNSAELEKNEIRFLKRTADFLHDNPGTKIYVYPQWYEEKEKEHLLLFEAKKNFYVCLHNIKPSSLTENDVNLIQNLSIKDSAFVRFINYRTKKLHLFTLQDKAAVVVTATLLQNKFEWLNAQRAKEFMSYFRERGVQNQVKLYAGKNRVPFNGFSVYKIKYKNKLPEDVIRAYNRMNELDKEPLRARFLKKRSANNKRP